MAPLQLGKSKSCELPRARKLKFVLYVFFLSLEHKKCIFHSYTLILSSYNLH